MFLNVILSHLKSVVLCILNLIKRSLCCFRRRRKSSVDSVPLTGIGIIPNYETPQDLENWNNWEDSQDKSPQTVQEHIDHYRRQRLAAQRKSESDEMEQPDYFMDMEPHIKRQMKLYVKTKNSSVESSSSSSSRLAFVPNEGPDLVAWEDKEKASRSWVEAEEWEAEGVLREKRREEYKKRLLEKEQRKPLASRVS